MRLAGALACVLMLAACSDRREGAGAPTSGPPTAPTPPPAPAVVDAAEPFGFAGIVKRVPAKLGGLERTIVMPMEDVQVVAATFKSGTQMVSLNMSAPSDVLQARDFYQSQYEQTIVDGFVTWVRHWTEDGKTESTAEACSIVGRLNVCVGLTPGTGREAIPFLQEMNLRALNAWAATGQR